MFEEQSSEMVLKHSDLFPLEYYCGGDPCNGDTEAVSFHAGRKPAGSNDL